VVFLVGEDDLAERRAIGLGGTDGERLEVVAGLQAGDRVVSPVPEALTDGARVTMRN
jgi:multidrug efflux system membrane fusion protein